MKKMQGDIYVMLYSFTLIALSFICFFMVWRICYCLLYSYCIQQIIESIAYCHQMNIIHRDIKVQLGHADKCINNMASSCSPRICCYPARNPVLQ